jgi:hypothetical protein
MMQTALQKQSTSMPVKKKAEADLASKRSEVANLGSHKDLLNFELTALMAFLLKESTCQIAKISSPRFLSRNIVKDSQNIFPNLELKIREGYDVIKLVG